MDYVITATKTYTFHVRANTEEEAERFVNTCDGPEWDEYAIDTAGIELDIHEAGGGQDPVFLDRFFQET